MSGIDLEALGFTKDELQERVIQRICDQLLERYVGDEEGSVQTALAKRLEKRTLEQVERSISTMFEKHILPNVSTYVENLTLQETNKWGEKTGKSLTFIEYLIQRAEAYILEPVSYDGKPKSNDGYTWTAKQTRIAHLIHEHLHYSIANAMQKALESANSAIVGGIYETVKIKLADFAANLKVSVETKERGR